VNPAAGRRATRCDDGGAMNPPARMRRAALAVLLLAACSACDRPSGPAAPQGPVSVTFYYPTTVGGPPAHLALASDGRALLALPKLDRIECDTYVGTWTGAQDAVSIHFSWAYTAESIGDTDPAPAGTTRAFIGKSVGLRVAARTSEGGLTARPAPPMEGLPTWGKTQTLDVDRESAKHLFARR
jgi:hypothetical protein